VGDAPDMIRHRIELLHHGRTIVSDRPHGIDKTLHDTLRFALTGVKARRLLRMFGSRSGLDQFFDHVSQYGLLPFRLALRTR
jgi:hypothetical protein